MKRLTFSIAIIGAWLLACSGEGGSRAPAFSSGVPAGKKVNELSPTEQKQFCDAGLAWFNTTWPQIQDGICKSEAVTAAVASRPASDEAARMACTTRYDECHMNEDPPQDAQCNVPEATCDATVGSYESCLNESVSAAFAAFGQLPNCASLTASFDPTSVKPTAISAACQGVLEKCGGGGSTMGGSKGGS